MLLVLGLGLGSDLGEPLIELSLAIGNRLLALIEAAELSLVIALRGLRLSRASRVIRLGPKPRPVR
jgi:hypothetical protein